MPGPIHKPPKYALLKRLALALPGAVEESQRYGPWFNVGKKTFVLYWGKSEHWMLHLPAHQVMMLLDARPEVFGPLKWGAGQWLRIDVKKLSAADIRDYLTAAWRHTAPKRLQASLSV